MTTYGKLHWTVSFSLFIFLAAYLCPVSQVLAAFLHTPWQKSSGISPLISFPLAWVSLEYIRAYALSGFPWGISATPSTAFFPLSRWPT